MADISASPHNIHVRQFLVQTSVSQPSGCNPRGGRLPFL